MNEKKFWKSYNHAVYSNNVMIKAYGKLYCRLCMKMEGGMMPFSSKISPFHAPHGLNGIFISKNAAIGRGCTIFQQVTIGSNTLLGSTRIGSPVVRDNCYIGSGAKIIGDVEVGEGVRVGANCVVVNSVPDNSTVVLGSIRVIEHECPRDNSFKNIDDIM